MQTMKDLAAAEKTQLDGFSSQVAGLTSDQIGGLTTAQVSGLDTAQVAALTTTTFGNFTTDQVAALTSGEIQALFDRREGLKSGHLRVEVPPLSGLVIHTASGSINCADIGGDLSVEFRLFEVVKGDSPVLTKNYRAGEVNTRNLAHQFAAEVVKYFTNEDSFFGTQIAFSKVSGQTKEIAIMDWDGAGVHTVTGNGSQNILPSWHPSGGSLLYTSFVRESPDLWMVAAGGGKPRRISTRSGLNTGGVFAPDGSKLALTLSFEGNSEIYLLTPGGDIVKRLTNNPGIDSSPTWSPDGSQIAFVSDRHGSPQIWKMPAGGGNPVKLTHKGGYNQEPSWSPKPVNGKTVIAFSGRDEKGTFDIFTVDPATQELARLTENRGSNTHPTWAPNARAIAYKSSRGGIFAATFDGKTERPVYRGGAESPSWGPLRK